MCVHKTNGKSCTRDPPNVSKLNYYRALNFFFQHEGKSMQNPNRPLVILICFLKFSNTYFCTIKNIITE